MKTCNIEDVYDNGHCDYMYIGFCTAEKLNKKCPYDEKLEDDINEKNNILEVEKSGIKEN
jgi:hypothetical protein